MYNKTDNPCFPEDVANYLLENGFTRVASLLDDGDKQIFMRDDLSIIVHHDTLTVLVRVEAEPEQRLPQNKVVKALTGISDLKLFDWVLLFHAFRIIRLKPITTKVMKEGVSFNPAEALDSIFKHFRVTEDHNAIPTNY